MKSKHKLGTVALSGTSIVLMAVSAQMKLAVLFSFGLIVAIMTAVLILKTYGSRRFLIHTTLVCLLTTSGYFLFFMTSRR